jgi:hypothetical protein
MAGRRPAFVQAGRPSGALPHGSCTAPAAQAARVGSPTSEPRSAVSSITLKISSAARSAWAASSRSLSSASVLVQQAIAAAAWTLELGEGGQ